MTGPTDDGRVGTRPGVGNRRYGFSQTGSPLGGGGAPIFGHARQDRELPSGVSLHQVGPEEGTILGWRLYLPESWA
jgi:hypothetical protein